VAINLWPTATKPSRCSAHFRQGSEFKELKDTIGHVSKEGKRFALRRNRLTEDITFSSSALINQYMSQFPERVRLSERSGLAVLL
jgi:hypothetical protein